MPIKSDELCAKCYYDTENPGCNGMSCIECAMNQPITGSCGRYHCICTEIKDGETCHYFKPLHPTETTEEPDYDEILRTLF